MKTRYGFVSNSSTSSFVVITTGQAHKTAIAGLAEEKRAIIDYIMGSEGEELAGQILWCGSVYCDASGFGTFDVLLDHVDVEVPEDIDGESDYLNNVWDEYVRLLGPDKITFDAGDG